LTSTFILPRGALSFTGAPTWTGPVLLNTPDATISSTGGGTIAGIISGGNLTKVGNNTLTLTAVNQFTGNLNLLAGGLTLNNANLYTGATSVGTTTTLTLQNFGALTNTSSVTVGVNAAVVLDNDTNNVAILTDRLSNTAPIIMNGGV